DRADDDKKKDEVAKDDKSEAAKKDADKPDADAGDKKKDDAPKPVAIDLDGFEARALVLPVDPGELDSLQAGKGKLFYRRRPRTGAAQKAKAELVQFELSEKKKEREEKVVLAGIESFQLAAKADKVLVQLADGGGWAVIDAKPDQKVDAKIDLSSLEATID